MVDGLEIVGDAPGGGWHRGHGHHAAHRHPRDRPRGAARGSTSPCATATSSSSDCHLYHNSGIGVFYDQVNLHQSNIVGCHISYNAGGGVVSRGGEVRNVQIGTCDIESNMTPDGPPGANVLIDCTGGCIAEVAIIGCTLQHNNKSPGSANIRFIGRGTPAARHRGAAVGPRHHRRQRAQRRAGQRPPRARARRGHHRQHLLAPATSTICSSRSAATSSSAPNTFDRNPPYFTGKLAKAQGGLVFRKSRDCTLTGLHVNGVRGQDAAVLLDGCDAFNIADCTIFDSDGAGLLLREVTRTRVGGCVIRPRAEGKAGPALRVSGGKGNWITQNLLENGYDVPQGTARVEGNYDGK